jgi:hypothetical protein
MVCHHTHKLESKIEYKIKRKQGTFAVNVRERFSLPCWQQAYRRSNPKSFYGYQQVAACCECSICSCQTQTTERKKQKKMSVVTNQII